MQKTAKLWVFAVKCVSIFSESGDDCGL